MRKLIVAAFISLDGVMQAPGGPEEDTRGGFAFGGWIVPYSDDASGQALQNLCSQPFELLLETPGLAPLLHQRLQSAA